MRNPFEIRVFDRDFFPQGIVGKARSCTFDVRWNAPGVGSFSIPNTDPLRQFLDPDRGSGARIRAVYRGERLFTGQVTYAEADLGPGGEVTYTVEDDWAILAQTLGLPVPTSRTNTTGQLAPTSLTDDAQSYEPAAHPAGTAAGSGYYVWPATVTTAEGAIKHLLSLNFERLGRRVRILPDGNRGGNVRAAGLLPDVRFSSLDEAIAEILDWSGLGLEVWFDGVEGTLNVDVRTPVDRPQVLTFDSGIVKSGKWSMRAPTATRVVVGSNGEENARAFWGVNDDTGLEAQWGRIVEVFRDATGAQLKWPDTVAENLRVAKYFLLRPEVSSTDKAVFTSYLNTAGRKALAEGRPKAGLSVELSENRSFHFGGPDGVHLGDRLTIGVGGQEITDRLIACSLKFEGKTFTVTPQIGTRTDDPDEQLVQAIRRLAAASRRQATRK